MQNDKDEKWCVFTPEVCIINLMEQMVQRVEPTLGFAHSTYVLEKHTDSSVQCVLVLLIFMLLSCHTYMNKYLFKRFWIDTSLV